MEALFALPFTVLEIPNIKIKKPSWLQAPSAMTTFSLVLLSYFLVTGGQQRQRLFSYRIPIDIPISYSKYTYSTVTNELYFVSRFFFFKLYLSLVSGIIYDVIVEPPSVGSTTDEHGHSRPVAFMPNRVNGQYIMEGLASSFLFSLGGLGFIILDRTHNPSTPKLNRILLISVAFLCILVSFFTTWIFMRMKLPGYLQNQFLVVRHVMFTNLLFETIMISLINIFYTPILISYFEFIS